MTDHQTILLTGFGPFPGMPVNASGELARRLARAARARFPKYRFVAGVLPTEWEAGPRRLALLLEKTHPALALHFGVSRDAQGFVIETQASNAVVPTEDATGALPGAACVVERGAPRLLARLGANAVFGSLREAGFPARLSRDAGYYLCNTIFYHSLNHAAEARKPRSVGFIHIPTYLGADAPSRRRSTEAAKPAPWPFPRRSRSAATTTSPRPGLDWDAAVNGGLLIVGSVIEGLAASGKSSWKSLLGFG